MACSLPSRYITGLGGVDKQFALPSTIHLHAQINSKRQLIKLSQLQLQHIQVRQPQPLYSMPQSECPTRLPLVLQFNPKPKRCIFATGSKQSLTYSSQNINLNILLRAAQYPLLASFACLKLKSMTISSKHSYNYLDTQYTYV